MKKYKNVLFDNQKAFFKNLFDILNFDCEKICYHVADVYTKMLHYKILNHMSFLNKVLFKFEKVNTPISFFIEKSKKKQCYINSMIVL